MEKVSISIAASIVTVFIGALVAGTLIWGLWHHVVPYFFQFAIDAGLPESPEWWPCVSLKSTSTTKSD